MLHLLFAVHNHQPVGNFDFIFERAYQRAYLPFLDVLEKHSGIRVSIHYSGILLDWLVEHHPEYIARARALRETGQLEVLGGGYYEPILPMLTEEDRRGQIAALSRRIEIVFGERPRGMWLAERVWEPSLVASIADAGIEYVVLDGSHFKMVGKTDADLDGWFETEDQGRRLKLLPIHDQVRDTIPFRTVEDVLDVLRGLDDAGGGRRVQVVFGDDGEKFGDWPQTYETVYTDGWLDRFFAAVEAEPEAFAVRPLREGIDAGRGLGLVYLPPASYGEMMAWAQDPADLPRYREVKRLLWDIGRGDDGERFVRGTFWRNFLVKYPESNRMHKQALRLSRALDAARLPEADAAKARDHVWQGQCNCAYWHGVFGGLYLPHLRFGLYRHLIAAQTLLDRKLLARKSVAWEPSDWNYDGAVEHLLHLRHALLAFTAGGAIDQLWLKCTGINLCDTLTRRREAYHAAIASGPGGGTKLEDQIRSKEEGLEAHLVYDRRLRETCAEWLLPAGTGFDEYRTQRFEPVVAPVFGPPGFRALRDAEGGAAIRFEGTARIRNIPGTDGADASDAELEIVKTVTVRGGGASLETRWALRAAEGAAGAVRLRLAGEFLFCLLAGNAHDRDVTWGLPGSDGTGPGARHVHGKDILASRGEMPREDVARVTDGWLGLRSDFTPLTGKGLAAPAAFWRDAIETVSQSEGGYERVYQGTVLVPVWDVALEPGETMECGFRVDFEEDEEDMHG